MKRSWWKKDINLHYIGKEHKVMNIKTTIHVDFSKKTIKSNSKTKSNQHTMVNVNFLYTQCAFT